MPLPIAQFQGQNDLFTTKTRLDISGGMNNRQHATIIKQNQVATLTNGDITIPGQSQKRLGTDLLKDLGDDEPGTGGFGFNPDGASNKIIVSHGQVVEVSTGSSTFVFAKEGGSETVWTSGEQMYFLKVFKTGGDGHVLMIQNGTDNAREMKQDNTLTDLTDDSDDPPKSIANAFFRGRWWIQKDEELFYSTAYPSNYAGSFDRNTNAFNIPVGEERAIVALRDAGMIVLGGDEIWGINPSTIPSALDKPEKLLNIGCVAGKTAIQVGDDVLFLATDGVRGVFRTQQDKLQLGQSFPLSFPIKDEVESIAWSNIEKATAVWFDNKYLLALPVDGSSTNNEVWVFYPALQAWAVFTGWNVGGWIKVRISGEEKLYYIDSTDDVVYQAFKNNTDENASGTAVAITYTEIGRKEDMGKPTEKKVGGDILVKFAATSGTVTIDVSFDESDFENLGTLDVGGNNVTFPVTFPVDFNLQNVAFDKFSLEGKGSWYRIQLKTTHSAEAALSVLERSIRTRLERFRRDDSA